MSSGEEGVWICSLLNLVLVLSTVEWSCLKDFSLLAGDVVLDNLQNLKWTISSLSTVTHTHKLEEVLWDQNQPFTKTQPVR